MEILKEQFFKKIKKNENSEEFINWVMNLEEEKSLDDIEKMILEYIKARNYTWTLESLKKEYRSFRKGYYVSFTAEEIINKFKNEFEIMFLQEE